VSKKQDPVKKKKKDSKKNNDLRNRLLIVGSVIAVIVVAIVYFYLTQPVNEPVSWKVDGSGHLTFGGTRGPVAANSTPSVMSSDNYTVETIDYNSLGEDVYASLCIPKNVTKPPVVVVLPAATITKELDFPMAQYLSSMGYASITLDERGNGGQTGDEFATDWQNGFNEFMNGSFPVPYKQVYDATRALDYVQSRSDLDGNDVAILGESVGGMWSIITAGADTRFKGVVCISSSDFDFPVYNPDNEGNISANKFLSSVQPSNYLSLLPPRKLVMIHFTNDSIIPIQNGKALFDQASEPKAWYQYEGTTHGLPNATYMPDLQKELKGMLGK
jgi:cephalosporin-C deacetylase-like acetyl esterase